MKIDVNNLDCERGGRTILQGVSFTLNAGEALILRGPNGIGKTTLLRQLAGLSDDSSTNTPLNTDDLVFGGHLDAIKSALTVSENMQFWAGIYNYTDISKIANRFNLESLLDRPATNLSAGQKRRLGLTRFMISSAKTWLMDEPTVSLDAETTELLIETINTHCENGGMAIISTHIDLALKSARILDLAQFTASTDQSDPFLEGTF